MNHIGLSLILLVLLSFTVTYAVYGIALKVSGVQLPFYGFTPAGIIKTLGAIRASAPGNDLVRGLSLLLTILIAELLPFTLCARSVDVDLTGLFSRPRVSAGMTAVIGIIALGAGMVASVFIKFFAFMVRLFGVSLATPSFVVNMKSPGGAAAMVISVVILAPIAEEFIFRGVLLTVFKRYGGLFAVLGTSFLWALIHGNFIQAVPVFVMGIFMGILALQAESILPTLAIHMINNAVGLIAINAAAEKNLPLVLFSGFINIAFFITALVLLPLFHKKIISVTAGASYIGFKVFFTSLPVLIAILLYIALFSRSVQVIS